MRLRLSKIKRIVITCCVACLIIACDTSIVYSHYEHTAIEGWDKSDALKFEVPPVTRPGRYITTVGLRVNGENTLQNLYLVVEQVIYPRHETIRDTVVCHVTDDKGNVVGQGLSSYQYEVPIKRSVIISPNDSIHYSIRHIMKRSVLHGISDVGIKLQRVK